MKANHLKTIMKKQEIEILKDYLEEDTTRDVFARLKRKNKLLNSTIARELKCYYYGDEIYKCLDKGLELGLLRMEKGVMTRYYILNELKVETAIEIIESVKKGHDENLNNIAFCVKCDEVFREKTKGLFCKKCKKNIKNENE